MLILVNSENQEKYYPQLSSMHRLRKRVFKDCLGWDVNIINGMEFDQFDVPKAHYLIYVNKDGQAEACTRLLPTMEPYLLADVYPELVEKMPLPKQHDVWETTRFCADPKTAPSKITGILAAGMLEFALHFGISFYVSVSDIRIETIIKRFGWVPERLGKTINTGTDIAAAEKFNVSHETYDLVRKRSSLTSSPVIFNLDEIVEEKRIAA